MADKITTHKNIKIRAVALDLDGVVYEGDHVIKGAVEAINGLRKQGIDVYFVTNNSGKKRASISAKLSKMGITATVDHIITSGYAAAVLVNRLCSAQDDRILVLGSDELAEEFIQLGRIVISEPPADILVIGLDKSFNYERLSLGLNTLHLGATFVACNRDRVFPVGADQVLPACGPMVAALEWAGGKQADHVAGKPGTLMLELIAQERGLEPQDILVIGDSIESDIAMAYNFGSPSVLITGNLKDVNTGVVPNFRIKSLNELPHVLSEL